MTTPRRSSVTPPTCQRGGKAGERERVALRRAEAMRLRLAGHGYRHIAASLGVSVSTAHGYVADAVAEVNTTMRETAEHLRMLECARLDAVLVRMFAILDDDDADPLLAMKAADRIIRVSESRCRMLGLNLPPAERPSNDGTFRVELPPELIEALRERGRANA